MKQKLQLLLTTKPKVRATNRLVSTGVGLSLVALVSVGIFITRNLDSHQAEAATQLSLFEANKKDAAVVLTWQTASELNNASFNLERSSNGIDFETIIQQKGAGTSTTTHTYTYTDAYPKQGINYYRLKQTDVAGNITNSATRQVTMTTVVDESVADMDITVSPNPGNGLFTFASANPNIAIGNCNIKILDTKGQLIVSEESNDGASMQMDLTTQPAGIYLAILTDDKDQMAVRKLFVQR